MSKEEALNQLKQLLEDKKLNYSSFSIIENALNHSNFDDIAKAKSLLNSLVDNNVISKDCYDTLFANINTNMPHQSYEEQFINNAKNYKQVEVKDKALKGGAVGFLITFFGSVVGFIICMILGDHNCKKASLLTIFIPFGIIILFMILFSIAAAI